MSESQERRGCLEWGLLAVVFSLFWLAMNGNFTITGGTAEQMKTLSQGKQILIALRQYAEKSRSGYPDRGGVEMSSSNDVFRRLFHAGIVTDERIFGGCATPFQPDCEVGVSPEFDQAVSPGECHWMLMKHPPGNSHPKTPVIIENALNSTWPPRWDMERPYFTMWSGLTLSKRGRSWSGRDVIIVRNDGSAAPEKLRPDGTLDWHSANNLGSDGESWIDKLTPEEVANLSYWDIEER